MHAVSEFQRQVDFVVGPRSDEPPMAALLWHLRQFYQEIPGLALAPADVRDAFRTSEAHARTALGTLLDVGFLRRLPGDRLAARPAVGPSPRRARARRTSAGR